MKLNFTDDDKIKMLEDKLEDVNNIITKFKSKLYSYNFEQRIKVNTLEDRLISLIKGLELRVAELERKQNKL